MRDCYTALVTPMKDGGIDMAAFERLVEFQAESRVSGLIVNGTTGESPTTSDNEKMDLVRCAMEKGKGEIVSGCGTNSTNHSEHLIKESLELGIRRMLLVDCYYNGPSSMELAREYYGYLCSKFPDSRFIAYIIPGRTGCELSVEDLVSLHQTYPNLDTVKEATGNLDRMRKTRGLSGINIMSGDDDLTYKIMSDPQISGSGVISVMGNLAPFAIQRFCQAVNDKDPKAEELSKSLAPLFSLVTVKMDGQKFRNPVPIKTAMAGLGMIRYENRKPLGRMSRNATEQIRQALVSIWQNTPWVLEPIGKFYDVDIGERLGDSRYWVSY